MKKLMLGILITLFASVEISFAEECRIGFKRPSYKTRQFHCVPGQLVPDAYEVGVKNRCEDTEYDHFISMKQAWCAGLSEEQMKKIANDPRNIKPTKMQTNRSKGAKDAFAFVMGLKNEELRERRLLQLIELKKDYGMSVTEEESTQLLEIAKNLSIKNSALKKSGKQKLIPFKGKNIPIEEAIESASKNIAKRAAGGTARNLASMPAQRIPWLGLATMIGVTGWDIRDACATTSELDELNKAIDPDKSIDLEVERVCGIEMPTSDEILNAAKSSPREVWEQAKQWVPNAEDYKDFKFSEISWDEHLELVKDKTTDIAGVTKEKALSASETAIDKASDLTKKLGRWFNKDSE